MSGASENWAVIDLFSGAGGMSYGFHAHPDFEVVGAADAQLGKPSSKRGTLECNDTYHANIGVVPVETDLGTADPDEVCRAMGVADSKITVLSACPPCTGFSRTLAQNHLRDDARNNLVGRVARYVDVLQPEIVLMENARELVMGRFAGHLKGLVDELTTMGYSVAANTHFLNEFGLPQKRERAVVIAVRSPLVLRRLDDLWSGYKVDQKAVHVRRAIWELPSVDAGAIDPNDDMHAAPSLGDATFRRLKATPHDGGGWANLADRADADEILTPSMKRRIAIGDYGSHPDVYGRLWWDRPAVTIKRECGHVGNGRYSHPEQDRLCTVREMAILQGFPRNYTFSGTLTNRYRHIGDAVPPVISYQLAALSKWILTGERPSPAETILPGSQLSPDDIERLADLFVRRYVLGRCSIRPMHEDDPKRQALHEKINELSESQASVVEDFVDAVLTPVYIASLPETWLASLEWRDAFAGLLQWHHALSEEPMGTLQFEAAFNRACEATGWQVDRAASATQRFYDTTIGSGDAPGKRLSLKASSARDIRPDIIHISKLTEAAWIQDARKEVDRRGSIVRTFKQYQEETSSIFMLRAFIKRDGYDFYYELVEIPSSIFSDVDKLNVRQAKEGTINIPPGSTPRDRDFAIRIDKSDSKITLAGIHLDICTVHGRWGLT